MSEVLAFLKKTGGSSNATLETVTLDANGTASITCPFTPTLAVGYWYVSSSTYGYCRGDKNGKCNSYGYDTNSYYEFSSPYGITISGNNVNINPGFAASKNKEFTILIK